MSDPTGPIRLPAWAKVGNWVICVDDSFELVDPAESLPGLGQIYMLRFVDISLFEDDIFVRLVEIINPEFDRKVCAMERVFSYYHFQPAVFDMHGMDAFQENL